MEKALKSSATIKAFPTRATVRMVGPKYALMRPWKSGQPNKGQELTATTQDERDKMAALLASTMEKLLKNFRAKRTIEV